MNEEFVFNLKDENIIVKKIEASNNVLDDYCEIWQGLIAYGTKNQPREYTSERKETKFHRKLLYGGDISKYHIEWSGEFLKYGDWLHRPRPSYIFDRDKILVQRIRNPQLKTRLVCAFDQNGFINGTGLSNILLRDKIKQPSLKFLVALLNSSLINYWFGYYFIDVNIKPEQLRKIPIKKVKDETVYTILVDYVQYLKGSKMDSTFFERLLDGLVYELYLPNEIASGGAEFINNLNDLPKLNEEQDEKNLKTIEKIYKELSDPKHPVSVAMFKMDTIEEIAIIEGKK